jgi:hypothetical protein
MNTLTRNSRSTSATRSLRKYNIESTSLIPETLALCEMLRGHIDDTVVRAQNNLDRQRAASDPARYGPVFVYARGTTEEQNLQ